ncbi:MAG: carboxypeptidase regulatory-like domain-containing protein [Phycisphaerales bacterium]
MSHLLRSITLGGLACAAMAMPTFADGTISGVVKFDGRMAKQRPIRVTADAYCVQAHTGDPLLDERFVFNEEKGTLVNVIVYVSSPVEAETPSEAIKIDQIGCQYVPHVVTAMTGQKVEIHNSDNTAHNLNLKPENNSGFNVSQPVQGMVHEVTFSKPEIGMPLKCDVHSWMTSFIAVFEHPYHAVTNRDGAFEITGLPAGEYEISVWHEFDRFTPVEKTMTVTVKDGEATEVEFTYQPPQ